MNEREKLNSEDLAAWYLRLNGFLYIKNFVVHPEKDANQKTDVDVLAVRLPYRAEGLTDEDEMKDDDQLIQYENSVSNPLIILGEVKKTLCNVNEETWLKREKNNMERILKAVGAIQKDELEKAANSLYRSGKYSNNTYTIQIICFGEVVNENLLEARPAIKQITWDHILGFIFGRFKRYKRRKASHKQWDNTGHLLWGKCYIFENKDDFISDVMKMIDT